MNLVYIYWPLLWWWYNDGAVCSMFSFLQNFSNFSDMKLPPVSDIIFLGRPCSEKLILHASIRMSGARSSIFLIQGICDDSLQCRDNFCCARWTYLLQLLPMAIQVFCGALFVPLVLFAEIQDMWSIFLLIYFSILLLIPGQYIDLHARRFVFPFPYNWYGVVLVLASVVY